MHGGTEEKTKTNQLPHPERMRLPLHITKHGQHEGRMVGCTEGRKKKQKKINCRTLKGCAYQCI